MSLEEKLQIQQESSLHHYRTELPNIIFEMGLDVYEFSTYCHLKKTAGDNGRCWKSSKTLCEEIGISYPKLIEIKKALISKGLIRIEKRQHENGGSMTDLVTIIDLWNINMKRMLERYVNGGGKQDLGRGVNDVKEGGKYGLPKEEHIQEEQKEQQQAAAAFSNNNFNMKHSKKLSDIEGNITSIVRPSTTSDKNIPVNNQQVTYKKPEIQKKIYPILDSIQIPEVDKIELTKKYTFDEVDHAIKWANHPETKLNKSLAAALKWACQVKPEIPIEKKKEKIPVECSSFNRTYFREINKVASENGVRLHSYGFREGCDYVEAENNKIYYKDISFLEQICNFFRKKGIENLNIFKMISDCRNDLQTQ